MRPTTLSSNLIGTAFIAFLAATCSCGYKRNASIEPNSANELVRASPTRSVQFDQGPQWNTERYAHLRDNSFIAVADDPQSTFSVDVDTASYANVRRFITGGQLPPPDAVRIEELINYFDYGQPNRLQTEPVAIHTETASCPWNPEHSLVKIDLAAKALDPAQPLAKNLVFLVDVSGSMDSEDKLPLLQRSLGLLTDKLTERDRVAIVVYAGSEGLLLPSTSGQDRDRIHAALGDLHAGGSTNGGAGIQLAYKVATDNVIPRGLNRVILATDGDFNVGVTSDGGLVRLIEAERDTGVFLTVLGFGTGNYNDSGMEQLAHHGNGNYAYIDSAAEARRVLVDHIDETLSVVAKDVKIQVEFNPTTVGTYRLLGYEDRIMQHRDFADANVDAGDMGAGDHVTAVYELTPAGQTGSTALKYQGQRNATNAAATGELLTVKVRYKPTDGDGMKEVQTIAKPVRSETATPDMRFVEAVAAFGMVLRDSPFKGKANFDLVASLAQTDGNSDTARHEFQDLVARAAQLARDSSAPTHAAQ